MRKNREDKPTVLCGIYTRKSTTEGLELDFNTLDAQREAAEAYIKSQAGEGWKALETRYDDGGFTGGNMDRPALKRLLEDVKNGKVDCILVYKVDRLSRSLIDFSQIINVLDKKGVSFVSVTQQFNTSNSMGRLTLNVLLSFAQYEREIIAERTSDKMCAARRKGKWMGGIPMLGYDIAAEGRKLVLNPEEGQRILEIFRLYLQYRSLVKTVQELNGRGWTTKTWLKKNGELRLGKSFNKTNLHSLLTNMIYLGKVEHKGEVYDGEHEAIIDMVLWSQVQQVMKDNSRTNGHHQRNRHGALLRGLFVCGRCNKSMNHAYSKKGSRLYRYYVCQTAQKQGHTSCPTKSIPAPVIENFVVEKIKQIGKNPALFKDTIRQLKDGLRAQLISLDNDAKYQRKELAVIKEEIKRTAQEHPTLKDSLIERMENCEKRLSEINRQKILLENSEVRDKDIKNALEIFEPVWDVLFPDEQVRIINLLIEKVVYTEEKKTVNISFSLIGIQAFAEEANIKSS